MGASLSSTARQIAQRVAPGAQRKLKPFTSEELETLKRMAEQDLARMRELPSMDEMNAKDVTLDDLLSKLGGAIAGRDLSPDGPSEASTSGRTSVQMPPARPSQSLRAAEASSWKSVQSADDQPGRLQSYIIREILEARTTAATEQKELDLCPYINMYGAKREALLTFMEHSCLPMVGKVATFGHQYAFARPPHWWLKDGNSGARFRSEPEELRRRLMGNPVSPTSAATGSEGGSGGDGDSRVAIPGIFGGGRGAVAAATATPTLGSNAQGFRHEAEARGDSVGSDKHRNS
ncbi:hypothetical protein Vretimale_11382 [Volvox reticuliferus]|uniref:Uncharacterized protein n=2 Tax=Volvox reticuliferus TaxID=1737510 RepID=A0A8J4GH96_9CHLO|nr:hypothetical protein Vretimale_11382 [Volvox reticuliferus]